MSVGAPMRETFFSMGVDCPGFRPEKYALGRLFDRIFGGGFAAAAPGRGYMSSAWSCLGSGPPSRP
jgi:hypothetical protein